MPSDEKYYEGVKNVDIVAQFSDLVYPNPIAYSLLIFLPSANRVVGKISSKILKNTVKIQFALQLKKTIS